MRMVILENTQRVKEDMLFLGASICMYEVGYGGTE